MKAERDPDDSRYYVFEKSRYVIENGRVIVTHWRSGNAWYGIMAPMEKFADWRARDIAEKLDKEELR